VIHNIALLATLAILWLIPAVLVASLAHRKGYSFAAFVILALAVPWPVMLLVVLVMRRRQSA
jgi:hypothetical protein